MEQSTPVMVARIAKPHGIHGEVVLDSFTDVDRKAGEYRHFFYL